MQGLQGYQHQEKKLRGGAIVIMPSLSREIFVVSVVLVIGHDCVMDCRIGSVINFKKRTPGNLHYGFGQKAGLTLQKVGHHCALRTLKALKIIIYSSEIWCHLAYRPAPDNRLDLTCHVYHV
jgi:hypothetical protein